ncbi:MAG: 2,3-bisphosphoglycerate-independent phosphoglycerate mutase [Acidobacteriota bacterium]
MTKVKNAPLVLIVLDGFGYSAKREGNAIALARTPHFDEWYKQYPNTLVEASGQYVGLRAGQMGNSEVGHLNIGGGRIVRMDTSRIDHAIETGELFHNDALIQAIEHANSRKSALHLMGLVSHGGVHSSQEHLYALLRMAGERNLERVFVHAFLDGRDTAPDSGAGFIAELIDKTGEYALGRVATVVGRYYAMDRDKRWQRTEKAYRLMRCGEGRARRDPVAAIRESYSEGVTDEFVKPIVIVDDGGKPIATIRDGDSVIFFNFRSDRARQITRAFTEDDFTFFDRGPKPEIRFTCMTYYDRQFALPVAFGPEHLDHILADVFAEAGLKNLRIAETEKYAHVTFFFNGGVEPPFPGEERILIPSPKVATYDLKPEMSAHGITDEVVNQIESGRFDVVIMNYANADMVGHTGNLEATIKAIEVIDECLGRVVGATRAKGGSVIITADHGNAEQMIDLATGQIFTAHTTNPVPAILIGDHRCRLREGGSLRDIAPTMLGILGLKKPTQMTGQDLRIEDRGSRIEDRG